jgi:hypothetical protein
VLSMSGAGARLLPLAVALSMAPASARAASPETTAACFAAHEDGQVARNEGKLRAARASFLRCSTDACPSLARKDCLAWAQQAADAQPTVIIAARDSTGSDRDDVKVYVDGEKVAETLTGSPIEVDPGKHELRYETKDATPVEQSVIIREGEKDRKLSVTFGVSPTTPLVTAPAIASQESDHSENKNGERAPIPVAGYVLGGVSAAALVTFAIFAVGGRVLENHLANTCSPGCSPAQIAPVTRDYVIADVSLGVGVVAAGAAAWVILARGYAPSTSSRAWFDVRPGHGGVRLSVGGAF